MKKALITGVTGQDGSYLAEFLLSKGYEVHGLIRRSATHNTQNIESFQYNSNFHIHYGDLTDGQSLEQIVKTVKPDEVYNLAAQSHVGISFKCPVDTMNITGVGTLRLLEAVRQNSPNAKFYQASTSELYGNFNDSDDAIKIDGYNEQTRFYPASPYGVAKLASYWAVKNYRESYGMFAVNGILFNHESPRRSDNFVTQKIVIGWKEYIKTGKSNLKLGNLDSFRDWGHAQDYIEAMWLMLQTNTPKDYVVATGETYTVRHFVEKVFSDDNGKTYIEWQGKGLQEKGFHKYTNEVLVEIDEKYFRPNDVEFLRGDSRQIRKDLGWNPKFTFEMLVEDMKQ